MDSVRAEDRAPRFWRRVGRWGATVLGLLAAASGAVVYTEAAAIERATERWHASGDPATFDDLRRADQGVGSDFLAFDAALRRADGERPIITDLIYDYPASLAPGGEGEGLSARAAGLVARAAEVGFGEIEQVFGREFYGDLGAAYSGLERTLALPASDSAEHLLVQLALLESEPVLAAYDRLEPVAPLDPIVGLAQSESKTGFPLEPGLYFYVELAQGLALRATDAAITGGDPAADLERLWNLIEGLRGLPFGNSFMLRLLGFERYLTTVAVCGPVLARSDLERARANLAAVNLRAELRAVLCGERVLGHHVYRLMRGLLEPDDLIDSYPPGHTARIFLEGRGGLDWLRSLASHRLFLERAAEALERLDACGLEAHLDGDLTELPLPTRSRWVSEWEPLFGASYSRMAEALVATETRRRLALCGLAHALDGEAGLAEALLRHPDPHDGSTFARTPRGPSGEMLLAAGMSAASGGRDSRWPLWGR
ncbi:hypothetical protein [Engelhardtia mirabilis]|uniref:Uncharacterized protein n=1 Tax=Engelhardtia mirabilis TaxID=2528011 RepID=A0A518BHN1_9BACT|nr:hypothetical protein Pla133_15660 [Planctomycetes bacterium Pla133]QDV00818.1 hypothetical protein Pla86_15650 [Planctomycetes bacterium Pla86]